ncbi:MAG: hypothetical protein IJM19_06500, partial [Ruminococcus sp.]|nr:hypothetical protein [Ruminococcus sp.]
MNNFLKWFFAFISAMLQGFGEIFLGIGRGLKQVFDVPSYVKLFRSYSGSFGIGEWILSILAVLLVVAIYVVIGIIITLAIRKYIRFRHSIVSNEDLLEEISLLQQRVMKLMKEKDEIMAMKVSQMGLSPTEGLVLANPSALQDANAQQGEAPEAPVVAEGVIQTNEQRFSKLMEVDSFYKSYTPPEYDNEITLKEFVERYRNFACSRMHLYYEPKTIRLFLAGMASTKL